MWVIAPVCPPGTQGELFSRDIQIIYVTSTTRPLYVTQVYYLLLQKLLHSMRIDILSGVPEILEAVLKFFPLDIYVDQPVALMSVVPGDDTKPTVWEDYRKIIKASGETFSDFEFVERFAFYERAKDAYAVVATSEKALYANIILKKGII